MNDEIGLSTVDKIRAKKLYNDYAIARASEGEAPKPFAQWAMENFATKTPDTKGTKGEEED